MKNARLELRITQDEKDRLQTLAEKSDLSISQYMRRVIEDEKIIPKLDEEQFKKLAKYYWQLSKIGTNINQIAFNFNERMSPKKELTESDFCLLKKGERQKLSDNINDLKELLFSIRDEVASITRRAS
ncbi:MAG: plasmid mobilization relaxosome protein MobC [Candidatus Pacebacteria bacterium]|nr:plasmid mobilization relaxosome protein MobC [Candidatus Paceibacterota bacterium]